MDDIQTKTNESFIEKILNIPVEITLGSIFFISLFFIVLLQIFSRELIYLVHFLNIPIKIASPVWTEEAARWSWVWLVFITLGALEKGGSHLKVVFFSAMLSEHIMKIINIVLDILYLFILVFLLRLSILQTIKGAGMTPVTLPFSDMWLYLSLTIAFIFALIRLVCRIIYSFKTIK